MFESRPHKAVCFVVEREKEVKVCCEQRMPKAPPGLSGKLPGRSKEEEQEEKGKPGIQDKKKSEVTRWAEGS